MIILFVWCVLALFTGFIAGTKDRSVIAWMLAGFCFGIFATLVVALLPSNHNDRCY